MESYGGINVVQIRIFVAYYVTYDIIGDYYAEKSCAEGTDSTGFS